MKKFILLVLVSSFPLFSQEINCFNDKEICEKINSMKEYKKKSEEISSIKFCSIESYGCITTDVNHFTLLEKYSGKFALFQGHSTAAKKAHETLVYKEVGVPSKDYFKENKIINFIVKAKKAERLMTYVSIERNEFDSFATSNKKRCYPDTKVSCNEEDNVDNLKKYYKQYLGLDDLSKKSSFTGAQYLINNKIYYIKDFDIENQEIILLTPENKNEFKMSVFDIKSITRISTKDFSASLPPTKFMERLIGKEFSCFPGKASSSKGVGEVITFKVARNKTLGIFKKKHKYYDEKFNNAIEFESLTEPSVMFKDHGKKLIFSNDLSENFTHYTNLLKFYDVSELTNNKYKTIISFKKLDIYCHN